MSKVIRTIRSRQDRELICKWIMAADDLTIVELREAKRSTAQNDKMWALLGDIQRQRKTLHGHPMNTVKWKAVMMKAAGEDVEFLPTLDGDGFFPYGFKSSELGRSEMSNVIECIQAYAAREGLTLREPDGKAAD